jgi:hypothetical protein
MHANLHPQKRPMDRVLFAIRNSQFAIRDLAVARCVSDRPPSFLMSVEQYDGVVLVQKPVSTDG